MLLIYAYNTVFTTQFKIAICHFHTCAWGEGRGGGIYPPLGSRKMLLVSDFWKINKKFWCKSFVLDINFKKNLVQMRMG